MAEQLITCRAITAADAEALRALMQAQMSIDPGWPPDYAKSIDLAAWLGQPATLGRWVAVEDEACIVGHAGLGTPGAGAALELLHAAVDRSGAGFAEICRVVVDPAARGRGVAALLTRKAMRAAIEGGRIPAATVLESRGSWLQMMLDTGWREVGRVPARSGVGALVVLLPAERFVSVALERGDSSPSGPSYGDSVS